MSDTKFFGIQIDDKKLSCVYIISHSLAEKCITALLQSKARVLGFDIETGRKQQFINDPVAGLCPYRSFPSLLQFYDPTLSRIYLFDTYYIPVQALSNVLKEKRVVAHNAIFDLQHMKHNGLQVPTIDCSMIMYNLVRCAEYASFEEEEEEGDGEIADWLTKGERFGASLRACTAKVLGIRVDKEMQTSNWTARPLSKEQLFYAAKDSYFTYEVASSLTEKIKEFGLEKVYRLNREAQHAVTDMILNGVKIDEETHHVCCREWAKQRDIYQVQVLKHFGNLTNIRSVADISKWLERNLPLAEQHKWERSEKTGKLKSDAKTLDRFSYLPFVKPLLEYKRLDKLLSTYGESLLDKICPVTKRLHGSYTLGYTQTGRLSSRTPNMQNIPRESSLRSIFIADEDRTLVGADYSQIELRVAAELSQDKAMLMVYKKGLDLHSYMASRIACKPLEKVTKEERQLGKSLNFGLAFGLGAKGLVDYARWNYGVTLTEDEAYSHVKKFFDTYSGYAAWQAKMRDKAAKTMQTSTVVGKTRKLQPVGMYTRSVNHPVQGSAAEIVITALNSIHKKIDNKSIRLLLSVHDEIILEVKNGAEEKASKLLSGLMIDAYKELFPRGCINKLVEVKTGSNWMELK